MSGDHELQAVTFGLDAERFAIPVSLVREILDYRETFRIPNGPDYLLGLTELRGEGITTVDLRLCLGLTSAAHTLSTRILVVDVPLAERVITLGLVVDRVLDVSTFKADEVGQAPDIGSRWASDYIAGIARSNEGFVVFLDIVRIFSGMDLTPNVPVVAAA
ncbi:chemotaxis protein CheW [Sphingomonas glaciei]|uniref:Chemotaxis protein CheW n=1 Tax=Sphingomonas glaciei TaxID=2938948 RepID=A0ABY5MWG7_9SPHN|nr:chemotaxis protein CheW [Sphingomonas glaciei]UUR08331.1 chemotaxis protein CheW [Sphingomonas glaciei]